MALNIFLFTSLVVISYKYKTFFKITTMIRDNTGILVNLISGIMRLPPHPQVGVYRFAAETGIIFYLSITGYRHEGGSCM